MALSDTLTLVSLIIGAVAALAGQAIGLILYWNSILAGLRETFAADMAKQQSSHDAAIEQLHGRINNIRKEFVTGAQFERDMNRIEAVQREILAAIGGLGEKVSAKITELEKTNAVQEFRLGAIDDIVNNRNVGRGSQGA